MREVKRFTVEELVTHCIETNPTALQRLLSLKDDETFEVTHTVTTPVNAKYAKFIALEWVKAQLEQQT